MFTHEGDSIPMHIAHLTSAHPRFDIRIFHKMCTSLVAQGYRVSLVVADGQGSGAYNGVNIVDTGACQGRRDRILNAPGRVFHEAVGLDADLYHLHDPELLPIGIRLKRLGKRVIFDSHEDVPKQMLGKPYLNRPVLWLISKTLQVYEAWACRRLDGVITATPCIRNKFLRINQNTVDINNFPLLDELTVDSPWHARQSEVCYVGYITKMRGILEVTRAMAQVQPPVYLNLCGQFSEPEVEQIAKTMPGWNRISILGYVDRQGVREVLARSMAGLVIFHPLPNHIDAQPNKMFEYMSAGIPVIASDFPLWREIIAGNDCGLLVNPLNPDEIAKAIDYLVTHSDEAQRMGSNGRKAVIEKYNWFTEEKKLLAFYERVFG